MTGTWQQEARGHHAGQDSTLVSEGLAMGGARERRQSLVCCRGTPTPVGPVSHHLRGHCPCELRPTVTEEQRLRPAGRGSLRQARHSLFPGPSPTVQGRGL